MLLGDSVVVVIVDEVLFVALVWLLIGDNSRGLVGFILIVG